MAHETAPQSLLLVDRLMSDVACGSKTATIRWREGPVHAGPLTFVSDLDPNRRIRVEVARVTAMPLSAAAAYLGKSDLWPDETMLACMREHYPDIALESVVDVIEFHLRTDETEQTVSAA